MSTLIPLSVLCGLATSLIFRRWASPDIGRTVNRILAHLMELRLFLDEPRLILKAQRDLLRENLRLFRQLAVPLLITAPVLANVMWQADRIYGRAPLPAGQPAVVTAHLSNPNLPDPILNAPPGVAVETPPIRIPRLNEVSWRIRPTRPFSGRLSVSGDAGRIDIPWPRKPWLLWFLAISTFSALLTPLVFRRHAILILLFAIPASAAEKPPLILVSIDTLRADHLGAYGYTKLRTPNIDAFAAGGTIFTQIDAQVALTLPAHVSLMTSTYPFENRVEVNGAHLSAGAVTLASILRANGYHTAAFIGSMILDPGYGLNQGFETYDSPFGASAVRRNAALVTRAALQWLEKNRGQPVFAFLHLYDLHTPYTLPNVTGLTPTVAGYDAELAYIDRTLGRFREALVHDGLWDKALIVLFADHGEGLGDHGETSHGYFVYESTMHVPLIFHWPAETRMDPERMNQVGGLIDVAPTILEFLHIAPPTSFEGASLLLGQSAHKVYGESIYPRDAFGWAPLRALRSANLKYIDAPKPELYDLAKDPGERQNIFPARAQDAHLLKTNLTGLMSHYTPNQPAVNSTAAARDREVLGSLGYTSGGRQAASKQPADPKDKLPEAEAYESALAELYSAHNDQAIAAFRRIVAKDAANLPALCALGEAYLRAGNATRAVTLWQQALEKNPNYQPAADSIGAYWLARKDYDKACRYIPAAPQCEKHQGVARIP